MQKIPLLLTRPEGSNTGFARFFTGSLADKLELVACPLIRIEPLSTHVEMEGKGAAIFTSSNGVRFAPRALGRRAFCVGKNTTVAAQDAGWQAEYAGQDARELIDHISRVAPTEPLCHYSGVHVRGDVVAALTRHGLNARRVPLYDQQLIPLSAAAQRVLESQNPVIVPLFSPRAAAHFAAVSPREALIFIAAFSPTVAKEAQKVHRFHIGIAAEPTVPAMVSAIEKLMQEHCLS